MTPRKPGGSANRVLQITAMAAGLVQLSLEMSKFAGMFLLRQTRLDIMACLDPASSPGSKPQRFSVKNCKSSTPDKLQTIKTVFLAYLVNC